jgi:hypothetical protein
MSHAQIINRWPSISDFADDIGVVYGTAKAMRRRGSIPPPYWPKTVRAAKQRGLKGISLELLAEAAAKRGAAA